MTDNQMKLRVYWIPQVPMKPFYVPVESLQEAAKTLDLLAAYDLFQYENNIKGDYCNTGGLQSFDPDDKHDGADGSWSDWCDDDSGNDFDDYRESECWQSHLKDCLKRMGAIDQ